MIGSDPAPNAFLARQPDAGDLIEAAERELRLLALNMSHYDPQRATRARLDANILHDMHKRWGKP